MPYIFGSIPYFRCLVRAEYTRNLESGHGDYIEAVVHAVRCRRGHSLWFQTMLTKPLGGVAFLVPIEALVTKPCAPAPTAEVQPWDVFSADFGVAELDLVQRGAVSVLPGGLKGQYRFTLDFTGSDLADDVEQHKHLHVVFREDGLIGAYPNNRLLWDDPAFWETVTEKPAGLASLDREFRAEGNQALFDLGGPVHAASAAVALMYPQMSARIPD